MAKKPNTKKRNAGLWVHPRLSDLLHQKSMDEVNSAWPANHNIGGEEVRLVKLADDFLQERKRNPRTY